MIRYLALVATVLAMAVTPAQAAPPISAEEFATKCSTGTYMVGFDLRVQGGTGTLTADCFITLAEGVTLTFSDLTFDDVGVGCCAMIVADSLRDSRIVVSKATIDLHGAVQLAAGCCAGDGEPGHPEENGRVDARNSSIRGDTVELSASTADDAGTVTVQNTSLEALSTSDFALNVRASAPGTGGSVDVRGSQLVSAGGIHVATDAAGSTTVRNTLLVAPGPIVITTGAGGTCTSSGNTPPVACT